MSASWLVDFAKESNRIEGIRQTTEQHVNALEDFIALPRVEVEHLVAYVAAVQPGARLRSRAGLNVRVGAHVAPPGGKAIETELRYILADSECGCSPLAIHRRYEHLHPFTDGNGRSGRALWLWMMLRGGDSAAAEQARALGFLHCWYYQSLEASR